MPAGNGKYPLESGVPVKSPRLGAQIPIQTARGRHPFLIRPLPVPTKLASTPIGHCKQRWANPLPRTRTAAFDWPFRMDLKIKSSPPEVPAPELQNFFVVGRRRRPRAFAKAVGSFEPLFPPKPRNGAADWEGVVYRPEPAGGCCLAKTLNTAHTFLLIY